MHACDLTPPLTAIQGSPEDETKIWAQLFLWVPCATLWPQPSTTSPWYMPKPNLCLCPKFSLANALVPDLSFALIFVNIPFIPIPPLQQFKGNLEKPAFLYPIAPASSRGHYTSQLPWPSIFCCCLPWSTDLALAINQLPMSKEHPISSCRVFLI